MKQAVFLDRDGVLNREKGDYITRIEDFELLPHIFNNLKRLQEAGFLLIVISNQGGIAKGLYTHAGLKQMHDFLMGELDKQEIELSEIFYCPHHPSTGKCLCRKPDSLLVEKAIAKYNIQPDASFFIGDKPRDIEAGLKAGVKGMLIEANADWTKEVTAILK